MPSTDEVRNVCASSADVGLGAATSAVVAGTEVGALVGEGGGVGSTAGEGVALEQAAMRTKRIGRIFFIEKFCF
jgi:hypothetical protein